MSTLTPNLSLTKPAGGEAADIAVLNGNMDILDNAVTLAGGQTLTNKTLTSPHLTTPVVDSGGLTITAGGITLNGGSLTLGTGTSITGTGANPAGTGDIRLANASLIAWRNQANSANLTMTADASDHFALAGGWNTSATIGAAGGASAQPATPLGYLVAAINGTTVKIPYHNP